MADVLDQPIIALAEHELTSRGDRPVGVGGTRPHRPTKCRVAETGQTYLPNAERHQRHQAALARQIAVYGQLLGD